MKNIFFLLIILLQSCRIGGLTNDYKTLNEDQRMSITPYSDGVRQENGKIYKLNAQQLLGELENYPISLVYIFKNGCTSDLCKPMAVYEDYAKAHNMKLFLVMNGYGNLAETTDQPLTNPLYAIDSEFYGEKYRFKYQRHFENDLLGLPLNKKEEYKGNLYFFNVNRLDRIEKELQETKKQELQF